MSKNPLPEEFLKKSKQERETIVNNNYKNYLINDQNLAQKTFKNHRSAINYFLEVAKFSRIGQGTSRRPGDDTINNQYPRYLKRFNEWFNG